MALAYFITFTTYGTWLPGNEKGSVDREHCDYDMPFLDCDARRKEQARETMTQPPYIMSTRERDIVCKAIIELAESRRWELLAAHVRSNHVHVVIRADRDSGRLMSDLKARASRNLTLAGYGNAQRKRWTRHGSTQHLFREHDVEAKIRYTLDEQGERMAWYSKEPRSK